MDKKLEQLFYAVLGGALTVKEKVENSNEEVKAWHDKSETAGRAFFDEMAQRGAEEKEQFRGIFKDLLKEIVSELDLATKDDLQKLKQELGK